MLSQHVAEGSPPTHHLLIKPVHQFTAFIHLKYSQSRRHLLRRSIISRKITRALYSHKAMKHFGLLSALTPYSITFAHLVVDLMRFRAY
jgi:hypothetical protein